MNSRITKQFRTLLGRLPAQVRQQAREAYRLFRQNALPGYQDPETRIIRRFTMAEVLNFKPTFNNIGARRPHDWLVINTGLWICDFTRPWIEEVCFSVLDAIVKEDDGRFSPKCLPEDWNFSGWCARKGLKVFATTTVPVAHHGRASYRNDQIRPGECGRVIEGITRRDFRIFSWPTL